MSELKVLLNVSPNASVEVSGENPADVFEGVSAAQEVFGHNECGCCKGTNLRFLVRTNADEDKFYEMVCTNFECRAKLAFGCSKKPKGGLYPKRRWDALSPGEQKNRSYQESSCRNGYLPNNGWFVFRKGDTRNESHDAPEASGTKERPF